MPKRRPTKAQRNMRKHKPADPATQAWIASWPIERRTSQVSASKPFYGIPLDLQIMIFEYALETHESENIIVTTSLINHAYYVRSTESSLTRKGSRALLEVNALSRELALKKFSGSLRKLSLPLSALHIGPTPFLSTCRFDPVNDVICMGPFHHMATRIFPGLARAISTGQGRATDSLHRSLSIEAKHEWNTRLQTPGEFESVQLQSIITSRLEMYQQQLWTSSTIQNMWLTFEDLDILLSMDTRTTYEEAASKIELVVDFLLSNKSLKKVYIEKPFYMAESRESRRRTQIGDEWVLDFSREQERRVQKRAMEQAEKSGTRLTPEELERVHARDLERCILFIVAGEGVDFS